MKPLVDRADFPLLAGEPGLVYLDSAATSQKPRAVIDAIADFYEHDNANPHRGAYALSVRATERYHAARERVARFLGVRDASCLIFTRGTTESLNLVASSWGRQRIQAGDEILVTASEHHANFVPWQQLALERGAHFRIAELDDCGRIDLERLGEMIGARTRVVAFHHVSNVMGDIAPVREIAELAHAVGALAVCDGAQAVPHLRVDFESLGVDFYAFSGHKMCGPMGIGALIGRRELLEAMPPYMMGGDMIEFVHDDDSSWNVLPHKFEAGTPNVSGAVGLAAAAGYLDALGLDQVHAHERELVNEACARLATLDDVTIHGPPPGEERSGVVSFTVADIHPHDLSSILDARGVCIRAGHHCAQPLMRRLGVAATARASFYIYNDSADIDALVAGVQNAKELFGHAAI
ncbi:MAG TPA: SufS family cysteine desulfurase [Gemmatimonadaceae bacterium]|nr:SufS family cysteine desulfurase [Gemmatimonadaceae bacterium]